MTERKGTSSTVLKHGIAVLGEDWDESNIQDAGKGLKNLLLQEDTRL